MYIKDNVTGVIRLYGTDCHDSLEISDDGKYLTYYNLQCGEGSKYGSYSFVTDENGILPKDDEDLIKYGAEAFFNIGGFGKGIQSLQEPTGDLISRQAAINELEELNANGFYEANEHSKEAYYEIKEMIKNMPSAGKTETVTEFADRCRECGKQRKGHWRRHTKVEDVYDIAGSKTWGIKCQCDRCDFVTTVIEDFGYYKYCPNCGAHMIEEGEQVDG